MKKLGIILLLSLSGLYAAQEPQFPFEFHLGEDTDKNSIVSIVPINRQGEREETKSFYAGILIGDGSKESPNTKRRTLKLRVPCRGKLDRKTKQELASEDLKNIQVDCIERTIIFDQSGEKVSDHSEAFFRHKGEMLSRLKYNLDGTKKEQS